MSKLLRSFFASIGLLARKQSARSIRTLMARLVFGALLFSAVCTSGLAAPAKPLRVVITSLPPYVSKASNGHLKGIDGTLFDRAAKQLGFKYKVTVTNWDGMLAAVQAGRADLAVSDVAWTPARAKTGLFTDPSYYLPELIAERKGVNVHDVSQLSGHVVGAINGQTYVQPLNGLPKVQLRLYPDTVALLSDLSAGRIDVAFMDPLVMVYQKKVRPNLHYKVVPLRAPSMSQIAAHPEWALFGPQMIGWYVRPGDKALVKKLNREIHKFWKNGVNAKVIKSIGVTNVKPFLAPGSDWLSYYEKQRRGVDRPANWIAPSAQGMSSK